MTVTKDDFEKVWASSSPLTPYSFSDAQYKEGWNFVGATPPSRQMWDAFMQGADEKLKYLYQHEDIPLGHEYFTFNPNVPQGSLPLFGGEHDRETYADLWAWVQEQTGYLKTEAEWQTLSASNNGNVPYYSDGDGSTTFRVPSLKCWVKGANGTVTEVGSYLEAGLPNITGEVELASTASNGARLFSEVDAVSGSLYPSGSYSQPYGTQYVSITSKSINHNISLDASRSNSIYGNSTTVQPPSIVGMWLVKAYGVIVDTGTIDEQQYIDDRYNAMKQYVDDEIADVNAKIDTVSTAEMSLDPLGSGKIHFTKKGNICMANFDNVYNIPTGATWLTNSIPQGFVPLDVAKTKYADSTSTIVLVQLLKDGRVYFYNYGAAASQMPICVTLTYICAD